MSGIIPQGEIMKADRSRRLRLLINTLLALAVIFHVLCLSSLWTGSLDRLFNDSSHRIGKGADFFQFYQAGYDLIHGRSIYHPLERVVPYQAEFHYMPAMALPGLLLLLLKPFIAYGVWAAFMEAAYLACAGLVRAFFTDRYKYRAALCLWFFFTPWYPDLYLGQVNAVMTLLLILIIRDSEENDRLRTGMVFGLSLIVKLWTLLLLPVWIRLRRLRLAAVGVLVLTLGTLPYFIAWPEDLAFMAKYILGFQPQMHAGNLGWHPVIYHMGWITGLEEHVGTIAAVFTGIIIMISTLATFRAGDKKPVMLVNLWVCTYFMGYRFIWEHHYVMLLPVLCLLAARKGGWSIWVPAILIALPTPHAILDLFPQSSFYDPEVFWLTGPALAYHIIKPLAVLMIYINVLGSCLRASPGRIPPWAAAGILVVFTAVSNLGAGSRTARDAEVMGLRALARKDNNNAIAHFKQALDRKPGYARALVLLARAALDSGQVELCLNALDQLPEPEDFPEDITREAVSLYERTGKTDKARALKEKYPEIHPYSKSAIQ